MKTSAEKRWERMQELLFAESRGDAPVRVSSQRTLFGIKSHVEQVIDAVAAEDRARCEANLRNRNRRQDDDGDLEENDEPTEQ